MPTATKPTGSQFDGLLAPRKKHLLTPEISINPVEPVSKRRPTLAKSKNPDFKASTLYLRKKTLAQCEYRLRDIEDARDMSELIEDLMVHWLASSNV